MWCAGSGDHPGQRFPRPFPPAEAAEPYRRHRGDMRYRQAAVRRIAGWSDATAAAGRVPDGPDSRGSGADVPL